MSTNEQGDTPAPDEGWMAWARPSIEYFRTPLDSGDDPAALMENGVSDYEREPKGWDFDDRILIGYQLPGGPEMKPFTVEVVAPDPDEIYPRTTYCVLAASPPDARVKVIKHYAHAQMLDEDVAGNPQAPDITVLSEHAGTPRTKAWTDLRNAG